MFPYLAPRRLVLGPFEFNPQLVLASIGILLVHFLLLRRARGAGLNRETAGMMTLWMVVFGFVAGYWFRGFYSDVDVKQDWRFLLSLQPGAASFGGIAGGLLAGWVYLKIRRVPAPIRYLDELAAVFPMGWVFGRLGCAAIHDHPGLLTSSWLGVRFPEGTRFDLGLVEALFLMFGMIPLFLALGRLPRWEGFWLGAFLAIYGAFRIALDQLHVDPPRYGPLTVDQWAYGSALLAGLLILRTGFPRRT